MSYYVHQIQGRLRVKTPLLKGNASAARNVEKLLRPIPGVKRNAINTVTGSAVIYYDPQAVSSKEILDILNVAGYFDLSKAVTNDQRVYATAVQTGGILWKVLAGALVERVFQGSALSLLAALI
jgi:copper chaperone CopZ